VLKDLYGGLAIKGSKECVRGVCNVWGSVESATT
jgi:hypothetical protein